MRSTPASRPLRGWYVPAVCGILLLLGCSAKYTQVPPRLDLQRYGRIALITFTASPEHQETARLASQRFAEAVLAAQPGIEVLELAATDSILKAHPAGTDPVVLAQAIGEARDIPAVFVGELLMSGVKPKARLGVSDVSLRATISAKLSVRLLSARAGGTMWRSSSAASGHVGRVDLAGGLPSVAIRDTEEAYGELVNSMIDDVTVDLRPGWVKQ